VIYIILLAAAGWPVGIVVNWLADVTPYRKPWNTPLLCAYCGQELPSAERSGLLSALLWRGRCVHCLAPPPWRRPLTELATVAAWAYLAYRFTPGIHLALTLVYAAILLAVTVTDLEHRLIPNRIIYPAIAVGLIASLVDPTLTFWQSLLGMIFGFGLFLLFAIVGRGALGMGDVKLAAFLGATLGLPLALVGLLGGILLGGLVSAVLLVTRRVELKSYIPYGPFLTVAGWAAMVHGAWIIRLWLGG